MARSSTTISSELATRRRPRRSTTRSQPSSDTPVCHRAITTRSQTHSAALTSLRAIARTRNVLNMATTRPRTSSRAHDTIQNDLRRPTAITRTKNSSSIDHDEPSSSSHASRRPNSPSRDHARSKLARHRSQPAQLVIARQTTRPTRHRPLERPRPAPARSKLALSPPALCHDTGLPFVMTLYQQRSASTYETHS